MASGCSHFWRGLAYVGLSILLAIVAISHAPKSGRERTPTSNLTSYAETASANASRALRRFGYNFVAALLETSPARLLPSPEGTIFAVPDHVISASSLPPWLFWDLLHYHTSPTKLSQKDLLQRRVGSCVHTNLPGKNLVVTASDGRKISVHVNGVPVSAPDIFLGGPYAVHGLGSPLFSPLDGESVPSLACDSDPETEMLRTSVPWQWVVRSLSSNGYVSFSIALQSVLDVIVSDFRNLSSVTIFAPRDDGFAFVAYPSPLLQRIVRFHILNQRYTFRELAGVPRGRVLQTLVREQSLRLIDESNEDASPVNRVDIVEPDMVVSEELVIHGVSRAFQTLKLERNSD